MTNNYCKHSNKHNKINRSLQAGMSNSLSYRGHSKIAGHNFSVFNHWLGLLKCMEWAGATVVK